MAHELLALEIMLLMLKTPTEDSVEVCIAFLKECGAKLTEIAPRALDNVFSRLRNNFAEAQLDSRRTTISKHYCTKRVQNAEVRDEKAELEVKITAVQSKNSGLETQINRTMTFLDLNGWVYLAKTASWYKVIDQYMTFDQAVADCASRKVHLVSIHSQEEHDFVWKLANENDSGYFKNGDF
ncbi:unnamed protein product, partial [Mesorhabditis belari]|uniref:C-type lectin domain-containing protein n=1 Tax=Mesorhabditis belari TaxID=2138241 RepID=A0AAF3J4U0_9BILA